MPARYFLKFSYIGKGFSGAFKNGARDGICHNSIQGNIELGLLKLRIKNFPTVILSSRTDAGVHALQCTAHVDLESYSEFIHEADYITRILNKHFERENKAIVISNTKIVDPSFHARFFAKSRTYLYRIAVPKHDIDKNIQNVFVPIEERDRLHFIGKPTFNIEKVRESIKLFEGEHDFETFKKYTKAPYKSCRRIMYSANLIKGAPMLTSHSLENFNHLDYWDFKFRANGFLYNQIRRIVGALIAVGCGQINYRNIVTMLQVPSKNSWSSHASLVPPYGLYLCSVEYDEKYLI